MSAYASIDDLASFGLPAAALASVPDAAKTSAIEAASSLFESYAGSRFPGPYTSVGVEVRQAVVAIAVYTLMASRGYNPAASGADANIRLRYEDAIGWMTKVSQGNAQPNVTSAAVTAAPDAYAEARIITSPRQGW